MANGSNVEQDSLPPAPTFARLRLLTCFSHVIFRKVRVLQLQACTADYYLISCLRYPLVFASICSAQLPAITQLKISHYAQ